MENFPISTACLARAPSGGVCTLIYVAPVRWAENGIGRRTHDPLLTNLWRLKKIPSKQNESRWRGTLHGFLHSANSDLTFSGMTGGRLSFCPRLVFQDYYIDSVGEMSMNLFLPSRLVWPIVRRPYVPPTLWRHGNRLPAREYDCPQPSQQQMPWGCVSVSTQFSLRGPSRQFNVCFMYQNTSVPVKK